MKQKKLIFAPVILILNYFLTGCSSASIKVETNPQGADIFISSEGEVPTKVGQSPLSIDLSQYKFQNEPVTVTVSKFGYKKESVIFPANTMGQLSKVGFFLNEDLNQKSSQDIDGSLEEMAKGVAKIQELIRSKDFEQSLTNINSLLSKYPNIATLYGLQGNIYYLQRNIEKALQSYKKSESISPNLETQRMISKLESIRGGGER